MARKIRRSIEVAVLLAALLPISLQAAERQKSSRPPSQIVRLDPRFDRLVPPGAALEKIAGGFHWVEGPAWSRNGNYLLFFGHPCELGFQVATGRGGEPVFETEWLYRLGSV